MTLFRLLFAALLATSCTTASATMILQFPGLDKAIEMADVIAIVRIDEHVQPARDDNLITRHRCMVYGTLKGSLPTGGTILLNLVDTRTKFVSPFPLWSTHLVFLAKTDSGYRNVNFEGSVLRLSPFGNETLPDGDVKKQIKVLLRRSVAYWDHEWNSERGFLNHAAE